MVSHGLPGSISIDTRTLQIGEWFLALVGPRFDGHDFLQQASERGCSGVIANHVPEGWERGFVQVQGNTLKALHQLASSVRKRYKRPVVAITGSSGKTTTRLMTALALESLGHIHQTEGNLNNHIGVPLSLLKLPSFAAACVLELGMSHEGEILELAEIAQPTVRVVLNVGPAHMENFGTLEDIARAKGELFLGAQEGNVCIMNADDPLVKGMNLPPGVKQVMFGTRYDSQMRLVAAECKRGGRTVFVVLEHNPHRKWISDDFSLDYSNSYIVDRADEISRQRTPSAFLKAQFEIPSPGKHLAINACAAAAIATTLGVPLALASGSISKYSAVGMRCRLERMENGIILINDAYNANPTSMNAALHVLHSLDCKGKRVALLGDMLELGAMTKKAHIETLLLCADLKIELVGVAGEKFSEAFHTLNTVGAYGGHFIACADSNSLAAELVGLLEAGDVVLLKGSRGSRMEVLVSALQTMVVNERCSPSSQMS